MDLMDLFMRSVILLLAVGSNLMAAKHKRRDVASKVKEHYIKYRDGLIQSEIGYPNRRRTQLYSRNTGHFIQVLSPKGKEKYGEVVAKGIDGNKYADLEILTVSFGSVNIRGLGTGLYICFDKRGRLKAKKHPTTRCIFREQHGKDAYSMYESKKSDGKFLAFSRKGVHRTKSKIGTKAVQFVERPRSEVIKNDRYYTSIGMREPIDSSIFEQHKESALKTQRLSHSSNPPLNPIHDQQSTKKHGQKKHKKKNHNSRKSRKKISVNNNKGKQEDNSRFPPKGRLGNEEKDFE